MLTVLDAPEAVTAVVWISWGNGSNLDCHYHLVADAVPATREQTARALRMLADAILATAPDSITP